ncbi:MAG: nicotinamide riboside kinase [Chlamydiales bacterium]
MNLRIAISGSAGTGKTTLGKALARRLEVPFIEEGMRKRIEGGLQLHELSNPERRALLSELWDEQRELEQRAGSSFVVDRSAFDYIAFWLHYALYDELDDSEAWIGRLRSEGERYDRVLLLPWGVLPLVKDGVRSTNRWVQFHYQATLEATLKRFAHRGQVLRIPGDETVEQRVNFSQRFLPVQ